MTKKILDDILEEGFTLNDRHSTGDHRNPTIICIYQKGNEFIQYDPKTDSIISRYRLPNRSEPQHRSDRLTPDKTSGMFTPEQRKKWYKTR